MSSLNYIDIDTVYLNPVFCPYKNIFDAVDNLGFYKIASIRINFNGYIRCFNFKLFC